MGCDIHCYIEYKRKDRDNWSDFGGRINPGRNYWMFGAMGGVRADHIPFIEPRGWPDECASASFSDNTIYISETQTEDTSGSGDEYYYSRKHADECVAKGYCQFASRGAGHHWVTNSDHHSHSWLTSDEFELSIAAYLKASGFLINTPRLTAPENLQSDALATQSDQDRAWALNDITEYWSILAAMRCFEAQGHQARLVFWFDN